MGDSEETKSSKPEKSSSPVKDQSNLHVYPDWAAMQVYYGPRVPVPPYFNSPIASGHPPHPYMWGPPQHMMPPYAPPYAAIYAHGGVHSHPGVPIGLQANGHGLPSPVSSEAVLAIPLSTEISSKSSANGENGLMNKLKGFNGLAMSFGNGSTHSGEDDNEMTQSEDTGGSSDGSSENPAVGVHKGRKRDRQEAAKNVGEGKVATPKSSPPAEEVMALAVVSPNAAEKVGASLSPKMTATLELRNACGLNVNAIPSSDPQSCAAIPTEAWLQNERELKRERRKQSNRESARRSRLRKQAEAEELAKKVQCLTAENMNLISEIGELKENSTQLKLENVKLMEKLQDVKQQSGEMSLHRFDEMRVHPVGTADLLARVNNSGSVDTDDEDGEAVFEDKNSGKKLHQLLDARPRTDAVAAS